MAGYSSRQSTYTTGDTIAASDTNDEFDALLTAFGTSGHTHDGTSGNGGNVTALRGHALTFGLGTAGTDVVITFDGETGDGVFSWMEDEDYFKFSDDVFINSTEKLYFQDTGTYIFSNADGDLDIVSDGTAVDSINLESAGGITLDAGTAGSGIVYEDDGTEMLRVHNSSSDVIIESKVSDKDIIFKGNDGGSTVTAMTLDMSDAGRVIIAGDLTVTGDDITMGTNTSGHIMVADGTNFNPVAVSGDVTIASNGAVTIANQAVENAMLADDAVGADELAANAVVDASVASGAAIAISKTALVAGTNITLSSNTLNVDDAFLINSGNDTTSGVITSAGYKLNVGAGSGDVTTEFQQGGTTLFTVGIDDSDSEKFKIHSSTSLADTSDLEITSAGVVSLASDLHVGGNTVLTGNLTVNGTTTTVNTATMAVVDPIIHLQTASDGGALGSDTDKDVGLVMQYHNGSAAKNAFLGWDDSAGKLTFVPDASLSGEVVTGSAGTIVADTEGTHTGNVVVANDGDIGSAGATDAMQISSAGIVTFKDDLKIKDGGTIGVASAADAMTISSAGIVTFKDDIVLKDAATIGNASVADVMTLASTGIVTFKDDIIIKDAGTIGSASDTDAMAISSGGVVNFTQAPTVASAAIKTAGTETIWVPASAMYPCTSNGCSALTQVETTANQPEMKVLDFDKDSDEFAQFTVAFPKAWNAGTITYRAFWFGLAATTGVAWALQGRSVADNAESVGAFGTAIVVQDDSQGDATEVLISGTSSAVTISGAADDTLTFFQVYRDVSDGNDDMAGDARLAGIQIFYTTNAANDA